MKLLTVTVPCYNSEDYMAACLDSLVLGGDRVEVIVINDGSKDRTGAIADEYAARYPDIIRVIHQENGGHGEGINQGLKHATGTYFKVVDSDDKMSADFPAFLDALEECEKQGGIDLMVTNYFYVHEDGKGDRSICYKNALPEGKIFTWAETRKFHIHQLISLHSATFRTELMRDGWVDLPKHVSYEDNFMICQCLHKTKRMRYINIDLYRYTIGREGQSVQHDVGMRKYRQHQGAARDCFRSFHLDNVTEPKLKRYLRHELFIMFGIACCFTRLNKTDESDADLETMWADCRAFDKKWADKLRYGTGLCLVSAKGKLFRNLTAFVYRLANKIVRFN